MSTESAVKKFENFKARPNTVHEKFRECSIGPKMFQEKTLINSVMKH